MPFSSRRNNVVHDTIEKVRQDDEEEENMGEIIEGQIVGHHYTIERKLGEGSFGTVYGATDLHTQEPVAIKMEDVDASHPMLHFENKVLRLLNRFIYEDDYNNNIMNGGTLSSPSPSVLLPHHRHQTVATTAMMTHHRHAAARVTGIPYVYDFFVQHGRKMLVMSRLGCSLETLFQRAGKYFSMKTIFMIAIQMIKRIEYVHTRGILHRDIKPDNFLIGPQDQEHIIYLVDYGLSKRYCNKDGIHIPFRRDCKFKGTARYCSMNNHLRFEQSRRDDLEAIGYVLMYFVRQGELPWMGVRAKTKQERYQAILDRKMATRLEDLCKNVPSCFCQYLTYVRNLEFDQRPDYRYLMRLFQEAFIHAKFTPDGIFDWMEQ